MKKTYILIKVNQRSRYICTNDLQRMYYLEKKKTPKLPKYDDEETCNSPLEPLSPRKLIKKKLSLRN